jgi:hypothetical protein
MPEPETPEGKYMYCIIRSAEPRQFTTLGIGERGDVVHTVHFMSLAAVVSDSPVIEYESSRRNMMAHTRMLEEVMQEFTILPVRFSTVAPGAEAIQKQVLERRYGELNGLLAEMEGRVELGLKAFWYEDVIFHEIVEENPPIRRLRDSLMGRTPEETYYERIRLGEMIENAMWKKRDEDAERILTPLRPLVYKTRANKVITDRMVLNAAFLMEEARQAEFDAAVESLDEEMEKRLIFKYVGPAPPYNFVNIVVRWEE